ncbi:MULTISPECIES: hypothetical protein [Flavobacterium]|uniref:hypothetical protein n=1 Tax=Flavobacterium TaxID=237 RepID=UPI001182936E|nr:MULTISPECIES: hypothetical protein [Flavobacterium]MCR4031596.1 hypothetical protein [Flavobacterium panacis]
MKTRFFLLLIIILPFFSHAQVDYSMQSPIHDPITGMPMSRPNTPKLETVKPLSRNYKEKMQAKLEKEERKLIKLAAKSWEIELDLRAEKKALKTLENNTNDPDLQKNTEKQKQVIVKIEENLKRVKTEEEISSKKVADLELAVEDAKFKRTEY